MLLVPWSPRDEGQLEVRDPESSLEPKWGATATPEGYSCNLLVAQGPRANSRVSLRPGRLPSLKDVMPLLPPQVTTNPKGDPSFKPQSRLGLPNLSPAVWISPAIRTLRIAHSSNSGGFWSRGQRRGEETCVSVCAQLIALARHCRGLAAV